MGREIDIFSFFFFAAHPNRCFDYIEEKAYRVGERREIKGQCKEIMCMSDYTLRTKSLVYIEWECLFGRATTESRSYRIVNFVFVFFFLVGFVCSCAYVHRQRDTWLDYDLSLPFPSCCPRIMGNGLDDANAYIKEERVLLN